MNSLLARALREWPLGQDHPVLVAELDREHGDADRIPALVSALLQDLAHPVESPLEAVRLLINQERFAQAAQQIDDLEHEATREELEQECARARRAASLRLDRRRSELADRARHVDEHVRTIDVRLEDGGTSDVKALLDDWEQDLQRAEKQRREELKAELSDVQHTTDHPEWASSVQDCIDDGDFRTARLLLDAGPTGDPMERTPAVIPLLPPWPWPGTPIETVLGWYETGHTVGFNDRWKPKDSDTTAAALLAALRSLHRQVDADAVRALTAALDRLLDTGGTASTVQAVAGAFRTSLGGLSHAGLPDLKLRAQMELWVAGSGWRPPRDGPRPAVWFIPDTLEPVQHEGIAVLTPETLFRLITVPTPSSRRLNLLREIYQQLGFDDLVGPGHGFHAGRSASLRTDLAWTLDLLGVTAEPGVLDALLYDVGGHPRALRAALEALVGGAPRPPRLSRADVSAWRSNLDARIALRERVFAGLDEAPIAVLMVLSAESSGATHAYSREDIEAMLWIVEENAGEAPSEPAAGTELDPVFAQLCARDLLRQEGNGYRFPSPGLAGLLYDDEEQCRERGLKALRALRSRRNVVVESLCQSLSSEALRHLSKNDIAGLRELLSKLKDVSAEPEPDMQGIRDDLDVAFKRVNELLRSSSTITPEDATERMKPTEFDLTQQLMEIIDGAALGRTQRILFDPPGPLRVRLSRHVVRIALQNLIDNAVHATAT